MSVQVRGRIANPIQGNKGTERLASELSERIIALEKEVRRLSGGTVDTFVAPEVPAFGRGSGSGTTVVNSSTTTNVTNVTEAGDAVALALALMGA